MLQTAYMARYPVTVMGKTYLPGDLIGDPAIAPRILSRLVDNGRASLVPVSNDILEFDLSKPGSQSAKPSGPSVPDKGNTPAEPKKPTQPTKPQPNANVKIKAAGQEDPTPQPAEPNPSPDPQPSPQPDPGQPSQPNPAPQPTPAPQPGPATSSPTSSEAGAASPPESKSSWEPGDAYEGAWAKAYTLHGKGKTLTQFLMNVCTDMGLSPRGNTGQIVQRLRKNGVTPVGA